MSVGDAIEEFLLAWGCHLFGINKGNQNNY